MKYLEREPRLDLLPQRLGDATIEVRQDLHRQLRLDAALADQVIESVGQRHADAKVNSSQYRIAKPPVDQRRCTCYGDRSRNRMRWLPC